MASPINADKHGLNTRDLCSAARGRLDHYRGGVILWSVLYYFMLIGIPLVSVGLTGLAAYHNYNLNALGSRDVNATSPHAHHIPVSILVVSGLLSLLTLLEAGLKPSAKYTRILLTCDALKSFVDTFEDEQTIISLKTKDIAEKDFVLTQWRIWKAKQLDAIEVAWIRDTDPPECTRFDLEGTVRQAVKQAGS